MSVVYLSPSQALRKAFLFPANARHSVYASGACDKELETNRMAGFCVGGTMTYYETREWKELRDAAIKRDGYKCLRCGSKRRLTAHHKIPRTDGGPDTLDNLKTVCDSCHIKEHSDYMKSKQTKYNPTDDELREMGLEW